MHMIKMHLNIPLVLLHIKQVTLQHMWLLNVLLFLEATGY